MPHDIKITQKMLMTGDGIDEILIEAAEKHGQDSDADHEVGDLQDLLRACWAEMNPQQRARVLAGDAVDNLVQSNLGEGTVSEVSGADPEETAQAVTAFQEVGLKPYHRNDTSMLITLNVLRLKAVLPAERPRYVHGTWTHIFGPGSKETVLRIVFDRQENSLVACEYEDPPRGWFQASSSDGADVEDSLKNANEEAIDSPAEYGLEESDGLPDWTREPTGAERPRPRV